MPDFIKTNRTSFASSSRTTYDAGLRDYMLRVYNFMGIALAITGLVSFAVASTPSLMQLIFNTPLRWLVLLAPLVFVFFIGNKIYKSSADNAQNYLWIFSALMGLSLAPIFFIYTGSSIARAFFISASLFGSMSLYGYTTKKDLTSFGSFLMMGLIGLIIASIVNFFLRSSGLDFALSLLTVAIFIGLTAYDAQKTKDIYYQFSSDSDMVKRSSVIAALSLYMDFINIFLAILRLFGDRRD